MNDKLRQEVKMLKALQNVPYREIAEYLEIRTDSFYNWLHGYYDLGEQKQQRLREIISNIKE